ncbi:MAG: O-antigen ligase family protein [Rhodospirillales bacterium]|nr:O-antigen ligase family protein [Rhodospirillales bacterium]
MHDKATQKIHNGHILGVSAFLFVPMATLLARGIAPLFVVAALGVLLTGLINKRAVTLPLGPVLFFLAAFAGWSLLTWFWSISPGETLKTGISLTATFFCAAVLVAAAGGLNELEDRIFRNALILGGFIGFLLIAFEFASNAWLSRFLYGLDGKLLFFVEGSYTATLNPGLAATSLYIGPWSLAVWKRFSRSVAATGIAFATGLLLLSQADVVVLSIFAGSVVGTLTFFCTSSMPRILAVMVALGVLVAPAIPGLVRSPIGVGQSLPFLSPSGIHRVVIWQNTVKHIRKNPILGGGFDTSRALYGVKDRVKYFSSKDTGEVIWDARFEPIPLHPHNGFLQVWLELGAIGAVILLGLLLAMFRAIDRLVSGRVNRAVSFGMATVWLTIVSLSFGAWQSWWLTSIFLTVPFMVSVLDPFGTAKRLSVPEEADAPHP